MSTLDIWLIAVSLAMDCLAVSIASGIMQKRYVWSNMLPMALSFGWFQGMMCALGWLAFTYFSGWVESVDHWIAFGLLAMIGGKMIKDGLSDGDEERHFNPSSTWVILTLAVATSIDALAVGISFACLSYNKFSDITYPVVVIGFVSLVFSLLGLFLGVTFGKRIEKKLKPELAGGIILVLIGIKILIEHLNVI
ncbi:MAG: manganese efflux pump MntP family protein [Bacteroidaceae bacterium]|nr:manganese efflux pump MntP family protein [Bacteroidaceae bacterium]